MSETLKKTFQRVKHGKEVERLFDDQIGRNCSLMWRGDPRSSEESGHKVRLRKGGETPREDLIPTQTTTLVKNVIDHFRMRSGLLNFF